MKLVTYVTYVSYVAFLVSFVLSFSSIAHQGQQQSAQQTAQKNMPDDFVIINDILPNVVFDIKYHSENNFVGEVIDGYHADKCILQQKAAKALRLVYLSANELNLNIKVFDCYRPQKAVDHFIRWTKNLKDTLTKANYYPNLAKSSLLGPYIAEKSGHSRGSTLDLTLVTKVKGQWLELDMGSAFDLFDPISNTDDKRISSEQRNNRLLLKNLMLAAGFSDYDMEWWHFTLAEQVYPESYFNFSVK